MAQKCPIHSGPDTQAVTLVFLFLGGSMLKLIGHYPKPGNFKLHSVHHKTEPCLGYSAEKPIFISLHFCLSVLDLLLSTRVKKAFLFLHFSLVYLLILVTITLSSDCLCSCFYSFSILNLSIYGISITVYHHDVQMLSLKIS